MNPQNQDNLYALLYHLGDSLEIDKEQVDRFIQQYIDLETTSGTGSSEEVRMKRNARQVFTMATSSKIPNLRFRLGDVLFQTAKTGVQMNRGSDSLLLMLMLSVEFFRNLSQYKKIELTQAEAEVLYGIYLLSLDRKAVSLDQVYQHLGKQLNEAVIAKSLENLERISCIEIDEETRTIKLRESIRVQSES